MENERSRGLNIFRSAALRLICSRKYWIEIVMIAIVAFASPYILELVISAANMVPPDLLNGFRQGENYNIGFLTVPSLDEGTMLGFDRLISGVLSGSAMQCAIAAISTGFISNEFNCGYIIFSVIHGESRSKLYWKYIGLSAAAAFINSLVCPLCVYISLIIKYDVVIKNPWLLIATIFIQAIMMTGLASCCAALAALTNGKGATLVSIAAVLVLPLMPKYITLFSKGKVDLEGLVLVNRLIDSCAMNAGNFFGDLLVTLVTASFLCGVGWLVFSIKNFD